MRGGAKAPPPSFLRLPRPGLSNLLILGGDPADRERVAREFHAASPLARGPFITIRAPREDVSEALMPYLVHAPTGAASTLRRAEGGTLLLDDIDRLDFDAQRLFFEFLRRGRAERPEHTGWAGRIAVGSSRDLRRLAVRGAFLAPLFDTLDKIRIDLGPPADPGVHP